MMTPSRLRLVLIATLLAGALYGASYQQFRYFSRNEDHGASDAYGYLAMASGNFEVVSNYHKYRFVTPLLATLVRAVLPAQGSVDYDRELIAFYIVNFCFSWVAAMMLFAVLKQYKMSDLLAFCGGLLYIASRITVVTTGLPMVDAAVFAAVITMVWLVNHDCPRTLALCMPILALAKETMLPVLFLPLFTKQRRRLEVWVSIAVSIGVFFLARYLWAQHVGMEDRSLANDTTSFVRDTLWMNIRHLFSLAGLHDLGCGFTFLLPWAAYGAYLNYRTPTFSIPAYTLLLLPIGLGYAVLNGNLGRMLFISYPVVIPYALVAIQAILVTPAEKSESAVRTA